MDFTIYKLTNKINQKIYIGQTENLRRRLTSHRTSFSNMLISRAIHKYGFENFEVDIIEIVSTRQEANEKEIFYIKKFNSMDTKIGYNMTEGGVECFSHSEETRKRMSEARLGKEPWNKGLKYKQTIPATEERCRKISAAKSGEKHHFYGKHHSQETKNKLSESHLGEKNYWYGKKLSDKHKNKLSQRKCKYVYNICSPDGIHYETDNLKKFSTDHSLNQGHMAAVSRGVKKHYKQWTVSKVEK